MSLLFYCFSGKIKYVFILYNDYLVYLQHKKKDYGKGYTRTFDTWVREHEAERLVCQQHIGGLYGIYGKTGRRDAQLFASCGAFWQRLNRYETGCNKAIYAYLRRFRGAVQGLRTNGLRMA